MQPRRAIGVIASPGDRRDADTRELATIAGETFDWIIIREDDDTRGRERGEVARLMSDTIKQVCPSTPVCIVEDELESVDQALGMARGGDLVVIFADQIDEVIERVRRAGKALEVVREEMAHPVPAIPDTPSNKRRTGNGNGTGKQGDGAGEISSHERIEAVAELAAQGVYGVYTVPPVVPPVVLMHDVSTSGRRRKAQPGSGRGGPGSGVNGYTMGGKGLRKRDLH
jgi:hypothetical protein